MTPQMQREEYTQERLIGESPDQTLEIETEGRVIRAALAIPDAIVGECRIHADADGVQIRATDPSNVSMVTLTIRPEAFDSYDVPEEFVTGVNLVTLQSQLRGARMGRSTSDPVRLDLDTTRTRIQIERAYDIATIHRTDGFLNIDPDSIRQDPDIPDLAWTREATIDTAAFADAVGHLKTIGDHLVVDYDDDDLHLDESVGDDDDVRRAGRVTIPGVVESTGSAAEPTVFSIDYMSDIAGALQTALVDDVTLHVGENIPIRIAFERTEDGETLYEGVFLIAPRIQS